MRGFLATHARPPYDTDDKFQICVVTSVKKAWGEIYVYHTTVKSWNAGKHRAYWSFRMDDAHTNVRKWLV